MTSLRPTDLDTIRSGTVLVAQLEMPLSVVQEAATAGRESGARFVLNAAPARDLPDELLDLVDVLVVNEHEVLHFDDDQRARVGAVVVTLGGDGACIVDADGERPVPGVSADVVDTTGAGDTFTGYLAAALAAGSSLDDACARAVVAGALAVETSGAVGSIPTSAQVGERLDA